MNTYDKILENCDECNIFFRTNPIFEKDDELQKAKLEYDETRYGGDPSVVFCLAKFIESMLSACSSFE